MTYVHRVTFGDQYRRDAHPRVSWAHPDGWLEIEVVGINGDENAAAIARELAFDTLGIAWAFDYTPDRWEEDGADGRRDRWYPLGVLARVTVTADGHTSWTVFREFRQTMAEVRPTMVEVTSADQVGDGSNGRVEPRP